jgi:hypothetical protein
MQIISIFFGLIRVPFFSSKLSPKAAEDVFISPMHLFLPLKSNQNDNTEETKKEDKMKELVILVSKIQQLASTPKLEENHTISSLEKQQLLDNSYHDYGRDLFRHLDL